MKLISVRVKKTKKKYENEENWYTITEEMLQQLQNQKITEAGTIFKLLALSEAD